MMMKTPVILTLIGSVALSACMSNSGYDPNANQKSGALAGAALGAIVGASAAHDKSTGAKNRSALLGAAVGAMAGSAIGYSLDQQAAELRASVGSGITVTNMGDYLVVNTPSDLLFATDSATVSSSLYGDLRAVAASLNQYRNSVVQVIGHTDNAGAAAYNMDLSQRRAGAVASILIGNGVAANRVQVIGRGEDQPIASNLSAAGRAQNRRVEIIIRPTR